MEAFVGIIAMVAGLTVLGVCLAVGIWLALWMLGPINRAAGALQAQTRFQLSDVLGLMVLLQVGLGIVGTGFNSAADEGPYWLVLGILSFLAVILWAASVAAVSRAGIVQPLRRLTVMILLVPGTLAALMLLPALAFGAGYLIVENYDPHQATRPPFGFPGILAAIGGLLAGAFVIRQLSFWAIATAVQPGNAAAAPEKNESLQ